MNVPPPFPHQVADSQWLADKPEPYALLGHRMRVGKTRIAIDAAQELWRRGRVTRVIVVAPSRPRIEWASPDPAFGQLARFLEVPAHVVEYRSGKHREWKNDISTLDYASRHTASQHTASQRLQFVVSNYEFVRRKQRLEPLLRVADNQTILVLDESSAVANHRSQQHRACRKLRAKCGWVWLLNGTPEGDNPEHMFGQFLVMDWRVIGYKYISELRAAHAVMNPWVRGPRGQLVKVERWINLEQLARRTAPHVRMRTLEQVFPDMPPRLDPTSIEVPLAPETWRVYRQMQRDALAWLDANRAASAMQAGVKMLRLAQITAGFLGGVECERCVAGGVLEDGEPCDQCGGLGSLGTQDVGHEKTDAVVEWAAERLAEDPGFRAVFWCRFRPEVERLAGRLRSTLPTKLLYGQMPKDEAEATQRAVHPATAGSGPLAVVGTPDTGGRGLNMAAASDMVHVSSTWSLVTRDQADARILGPDQRRPAAYLDVLATGPAGEPTVDHAVVKALREKRDVAQLTAGAWLAALEDS